MSFSLIKKILNTKKRITIVAIMVTLSLYCFIRITSETDLGVIYENDFEDGPLNAKCSGNCPTISAQNSYSGAHAMHAILNYKKSKINNRTEIRIPGNALLKGQYVYSFSTFLPTTYGVDNIWEIVAQWHAVPDFPIGETWRNPVLSLRTTNGKWAIKINWDKKKNTFESGKRIYEGSLHDTLFNYRLNEWQAWKFKILWSYEDDGLIEIYKDNVLVFKHIGPNTFNDEIGPYFKLGIYKGWKEHKANEGVTEREVFFDKVTVEKIK